MKNPEPWELLDSFASWEFAQDILRLRKGLRRFRTLKEMYWLEMWGEVP